MVGFSLIAILYLIAYLNNRNNYAYVVSLLVMMVILAFSSRNTMISYSLLVIGAFSDNRLGDMEIDSYLVQIGRFNITYENIYAGIIGLTILLLTGHEIISTIIKMNSFISGNTTNFMRIVDCVLSAVGFTFGYCLSVLRNYRTKTEVLKK